MGLRIETPSTRQACYNPLTALFDGNRGMSERSIFPPYGTFVKI
jgi:hypothetical protein